MFIERPVSRSCSIAETRVQLPRLIREVEGGEPVRITRRGRPVAVIVSEAEFRRLAGSSPALVADYQRWRSAWSADESTLPDGYYDSLRSHEPGRDVNL